MSDNNNIVWDDNSNVHVKIGRTRDRAFRQIPENEDEERMQNVQRTDDDVTKVSDEILKQKKSKNEHVQNHQDSSSCEQNVSQKAKLVAVLE